jgi:hypothetical protein
VAVSPDTLTRFLIDQVLTTSPARFLENHRFLINAIINNEGSIFFLGPDELCPSLAAGNLLLLRAPGRVACTFNAAGVLAAGALLGGREVRLTPVAGTANSHSDRLIDAQNSVVGRVDGDGLPIGSLDFEPISFPKLLCPFLK